jgi:cytochrome c oxidase assembly protein subunit 11
MKILNRFSDKTQTVIKLVSVVVVMASLSAASVPFYDWFCRVTGFGGATNVVDAGSDVVLDQEMTIRFDASLASGMPW